ncbi:SPFH domain-containing protein [Tsukamurella sp. 8F]|uniref:SPFH domain-containing protein n=1 Tax=unclassified Tsukamurella TaxID=2633480 RepID=UPI0023B96224|nr:MULTISPECIES: SPFH domain-containing protein [unclassified Tsukamurella]MDF0529527.1 SPFH domain-containing protein [Tsukamurella sp. 8J]MDF0585785.1 SPFH domain-containing protein [Tsukamurella sp. 8F]
MSDDPVTVESTPVGREGTRVGVRERPAPYGGTGVAIAVVALILVLLVGAVGVFIGGMSSDTPLLVAPAAIMVIVGLILATTLVVVAPGHTLVVQLFGRYLGTVRATGLGVVPPFTSRKRLSVRVRNFETAELKVNDAVGNPVNIAAIIVWQVADTAQATFAVEDYEEFIATQAESALRHVSTTHPYDGDDAQPGQTSLRGSTDIVADELAEQVAARAALAGIEIVETRISSLAYAAEIAQAMLQRQQASALLAAREKIVEGAVGLVENALSKLEEEGVVTLDDERRASMVSNLLVVLCSDSRTTPVVNTGSLYA